MIKALGKDTGRGRQRSDRSAFWVAPPQRYVVNRHSPKAVPHNLSVIIVVDPHMVEPTAFLQPIALLVNDTGSCEAAEDGSVPSPGLNSTSDTVIPSLFRMDVYVWEDTTLREILEEVLATSAAAKQVLLPSNTSALPVVEREREANKPSPTTGKEKIGTTVRREEEKNNGNNNSGLREEAEDADSASVEFDEGNESVNGDVAEGESDAKRVRTEGENTQEPPTGTSSATPWSQRRNRRPPPMPVAKVRVSHVFVDADKKPQVRDMAVLRVDRPVFHTGDYTTMHEIRTSKAGGRGWKNGDLLVLSPTVRYYRTVYK
ncbi:putative trans-sialidase [Trypanosoma rangeli]|uniref:Putative trans-sialidase n=1 Tax=Trypanosoma rangeli TaxID=5698 RepID=A0A3R7KK03_TRYRA|nr:putative trans-sialidase [Trypanosoma rangeli]RNF08008.1 putative trans-sialidase [Trypanosoma rangeli]|eukprot:RNF08008.1 putative trans-sialidase [Trypanosoma rangeli]